MGKSKTYRDVPDCLDFLLRDRHVSPHRLVNGAGVYFKWAALFAHTNSHIIHRVKGLGVTNS